MARLARLSRWRTLTLGIVLTVALAWAGVERFGMPARDMAGMLLATLLAMAAVIGIAALVAWLWVAWRGRRRRE